uniref:Uncharacterized protein n=1 Tax=Timema bartmani TaxID=61472 RepID=A0A7R9F1L6_9NEOP|nr:unnamed protein product [Timema bartmani]
MTSYKNKSVRSFESIKYNEPVTPCRCRKNCTELFSETDRRKIIDEHFKDRTKNEIDAYLSSLIDLQLEPFRKFLYHAMRDRDRFRVCRKAFINLHHTSGVAVYRLTTLVAKDEVPLDKRGKHGNHWNVMPYFLTKMIHAHIVYCLEAQHIGLENFGDSRKALVVKRMYESFKAMHQQWWRKVRYEYYAKYFRKNFRDQHFLINPRS